MTVHKGLSWFIFSKKRQFLTFFCFMQKYHTAFRHDCTLRQSMKFANRDSLYDGILCMSMDRVGVFSGIYTGIWCFLVLTFKQKIERRRNAALTKTQKCFMILSIVYVDFLKKSILHFP